MKDLTAEINTYRECVRHLWNAYLLPTVAANGDGWSVRDEFDDVCRKLFGLLLVDPLRLAGVSRADLLLSPSRTDNRAPLPWLQIVPNGAPSVPVMINRHPSDAHGYWDHPLNRVAAQDVDLTSGTLTQRRRGTEAWATRHTMDGSL
jgi:hypothetical protein